MKKLKKIPVFKNEDEERDLWDTHDTTEYFDWSKAERVSFPNLQITDDPKWMWEAIKEAEIGAKEGNWATGLLDHLPPFYRQEKFHIDVTQRILAQECKEVYLKGKPAEKHIKQHKIILK